MTIKDLRQFRERANKGLLVICEEVHGATTGWLDGMPNETYRCFLAHLRQTVAIWEPGPEISKSYDDKVLELVKTVIAEAEARP
jgi:hypothetical protein